MANKINFFYEGPKSADFYGKISREIGASLQVTPLGPETKGKTEYIIQNPPMNATLSRETSSVMGFECIGFSVYSKRKITSAEIPSDLTRLLESKGFVEEREVVA